MTKKAVKAMRSKDEFPWRQERPPKYGVSWSRAKRRAHDRVCERVWLKKHLRDNGVKVPVAIVYDLISLRRMYRLCLSRNTFNAGCPCVTAGSSPLFRRGRAAATPVSGSQRLTLLKKPSCANFGTDSDSENRL